MADRLEEIVTVLLSVFSSIMMIMSMLGEILTSLLVQQQTQQNLLIAQSAIKEIILCWKQNENGVYEERLDHVGRNLGVPNSGGPI